MNCLKLCLVLCLIVTVPLTAPSVQQKPYPVVTEVKDGDKTITNPDGQSRSAAILQVTTSLFLPIIER